MALTAENRNYKLSDSELCMFTSRLCDVMTTDLSTLSTFGITAPKIASLKALGDAFEIFPSDSVLVAEITGATEAKMAKAFEVKEAIRNMAIRCQLKWELNSWQENSLEITGLNDFPDKDVIFAARRVHQQMTKFLPDMLDVGLTADVLDDFDTLNEEYETLIKAQLDKVAERDKQTRERIAKGNEIYALVVKYCEIGKRVFAMSDPAAYNNYIIYQPSAGSLKAPEGLRFYFPNKEIYWELVNHATSYELQFSTDNVDFNVIYAGADLSYAFTPPDGLSFIKCRPRNMNGFGPFCNVEEVGYYAVLPPPVNLMVALLPGGQIQLTWDPVISATKYKVYYSVANPGDVAGSWLFNQVVNTNNCFCDSIPNKRMYFRLTSENQYQASTNSAEVFIEIPVNP